MNAAYIVPMVGTTFMAIGVIAVGTAAWKHTSRRTGWTSSAHSVRRPRLYAEPVQVPDRVQTPLFSRIFGPATRGLRHSLSRLYPSQRDRQRARRPAQGGTDGFHPGRGVRRGASGRGPARHRRGLVRLVSGVVAIKTGIALVFILPMIGGLAPSWWLRARIKARRGQVTNDLPDVLDLMTISVVAGLGLEQAMQISCARFESPVSDELRLTLREMELGLSRHDALENMKLRTDIDDLVTFSVVLSQADALGLPIGRVLRGASRRDARQAAPAGPGEGGQGSVKILFPFALCFLPAIMIIVLGPIVGPIKHALHRA